MASIHAIRSRGHHRVVVKEAMGLAGGNALRLWEPEILETHQRWMSQALSSGQTLVIEPWLEREQDFSVQMEMTARGLQICGYTGLVNDLKGQFNANTAGPDATLRSTVMLNAQRCPSGQRISASNRVFSSEIV